MDLAHAAALQASTIAMIALGARVPQIWMNYKRGDSGELSLLTCSMNVSGCFARIFTTLVLTKVHSDSFPSVTSFPLATQSLAQ